MEITNAVRDGMPPEERGSYQGTGFSRAEKLTNKSGFSR
jgi:hypothetical protein